MEALPQAPWSGKAARFMANSSTPHLWAHVRQFFLKSLMFYIFFGWCRCDGAMSSHKTLVKTFAFGPKHCMMTGGNQPTMAGTREWDVFTKFRAKLPAGRTDWRAFQLAFTLYGARRRRKFGEPLWKEKWAIMLCHRFWVFPGCSTKTDSCKFELLPQEQLVFEETFTDWLWRLVRHVEDSLNSAGLLASTTLLLMPACKSNGWSPFRLQTPPHQVKGRPCPPRARRRGTSTGLSSNHRRRRSCQIRCKKVHCLTVGDLIFRDRYISTLTRSWTSHCRQWVGRFIRKGAAIDGWQPVAPPCLCGRVQFWSRDWRTWHSLTK